MSAPIYHLIPNEPKPVAPYSDVVEADGWLFVTGQLATDPRIAFLSFIGSNRVGWYLRSKLPPGTRCALEHGGAAPAIIDRSAELDRLIEPLTKGGYYHAGQVYVSVQRGSMSMRISRAPPPHWPPASRRSARSSTIA